MRPGCVVMAAGNASRFGENKLLALWRGRSLIERALAAVPAVIAYPTFSVATIVAVTLVGVGLFGERLGRRQWAAVLIILAALVLLNI